MLSPSQQRPAYLRSLSSYTQKNKPRLYIALYPRVPSHHGAAAGCDAYHWALLIAPATSSLRTDDATRFHLAHPTTTTGLSSTSNGVSHSSALFFQEDNLNTSPSAREILVRITIAKVLDLDRARKVLKGLAPSSNSDSNSSKGGGEEGEETSRTCFGWVHDAFLALHADSGCLKSFFSASSADWKEIEVCAREYCRGKRAARRAAAVGAGDDGNGDEGGRGGEISTFNAWEKRETTA